MRTRLMKKILKAPERYSRGRYDKAFAQFMTSDSRSLAKLLRSLQARVRSITERLVRRKASQA